MYKTTLVLSLIFLGTMLSCSAGGGGKNKDAIEGEETNIQSDITQDLIDLNEEILDNYEPGETSENPDITQDTQVQVDCYSVENSFVGCGGDLLGSWLLTETCVDTMEDMLTQEPDCQSSQYSTDMSGLSTTLVFYENNQYTLTLSGSATATINLTNDCIIAVFNSSMGVENFCDMQSDMIDDDESISGSCAVVTGRCKCNYISTGQVTEDEYRISGSSVILYDREDESEENMEFCIEDSVLILKPGSEYETTGFLIMEQISE